jgi:hypothetical protein
MLDFSLSIALEKKILPAITFTSEENVLPVAEVFKLRQQNADKALIKGQTFILNHYQ